MNPSRGLDAFSLPIYEPIFPINTCGQPLWKALFSLYDALQHVQYEAHYLLGSMSAHKIMQTQQKHNQTMKTKNAAAIGIGLALMIVTLVKGGITSGSIREVSFGSGKSAEDSPVIAALEVTTYSGSDINSNSFSIGLVTITNTVLAKEVGYKFTATGIGVAAVQRNDGKLLGQRKDKVLSFQAPIFASFEPPSSITMEFVSVAVKEVSSDTLECVVTKIETPDDDNRLKYFKLKDVSLGEGGKIDPKYTFILKKEPSKK
jgi:hypothetical protein